MKKHLQAPALSTAHGASEQVIPSVLPWGPQGWEMKLFEHLSVCRHSSECIKCARQSWRAYRTQVFAPDKKPGQVLYECGSLKRRSQDSISFPEWFIALKKTESELCFPLRTPSPWLREDPKSPRYLVRGKEGDSEANSFSQVLLNCSEAVARNASSTSYCSRKNKIKYNKTS